MESIKQLFDAIKALLKKKPQKVKQNNDGSSYIPIGQVEETLDSLYLSWGTENFRFRILTMFDKVFASGTVTLITRLNESIEERMEGSGTFQLFPNDTNTHYEATVLSYCISNAALRKGILFGRGLNGRLEVGENALPVVQVNLGSQESDAEVAETKRLMSAANNRAEAEKIMNQRGFKYHVELKEFLQTFKK